MIQLYTDDGTLLLGLTRRNLDLLQADQPLVVQFHRPVTRLAIAFGEDKVALLDKLAAAGMTIPRAVRDDAVNDPT